MHIFKFFSAHYDIIDDEAIGDIMLKTHPKYPNNEFEEMVIVLISYARIEVATVVVKATSTPIALSTVFGPCQNVWITNLAVVFVSGWVKWNSLSFTISF